MNLNASALPLVAATAIISGTVPGCSLAAPGNKEGQGVNGTKNIQAEAIARRIGITLPAAVTVGYAEEIAGRDDAARLALAMSDTDWNTLQAALPVETPDQPPFSSDANFHLGPDEGGWIPSQAAGLTTIQLPWRKGAESLNIGTAPADPGHRRVFIFWHRL